MPVSYKLYYFSGKGRGEIIRQMFAICELPYEDIRFEKDEWEEKYKKLSPFGQCPFIEIDDGQGNITRLSQSHAIARYFARLHGFAGESLLDQARVEMIADSLADYVVQPCVWIRRETDEVKKQEKIKKYEEEELPRALENIQKQLDLNTSNSGYLVGSSITWADMLFAIWMTWIPGGVKVTPPLDKFPKLKALYNRVESHPRIAEWIKNRPFTEL